MEEKEKNEVLEEEKPEQKLFTKEEVDTLLKGYVSKNEVSNIVRKRLERVKEDNERNLNENLDQKRKELEDLEKTLNKRSLNIDCQRYLIDKGLPDEFMDVIQADNLEDFKEKSEKLAKLIESRQKKNVPRSPEYVSESPCSNGIRNAFFSTDKRTPKNKY